MSDTEEQLKDMVEEWAKGQVWENYGEVDHLKDESDSVLFDEVYGDVELNKVRENEYSFTVDVTLYGEASEDYAPVSGDTINIAVSGSIFYNAKIADWEISDECDVAVETGDWEADLGERKSWIPESSFDNTDELLLAISKFSSKFWYRGHANESWELKSSIARQKNPTKRLEDVLRLKFENQIAFLDSVSHPLGVAKCNFLMQHHGVPTRLLDWTTSPLIALYFAVCDTKQDHVDGCVWVLNYRELNRYHNVEKTLRNDETSEGLYTESSNKTLAIHTPHIDHRMRSQRSVFTLHTHYRAIEAMFGASNFLKKKLVIDRGIKRKMREKLAVMGIDRGFLFPDLDNIARAFTDSTFGE